MMFSMITLLAAASSVVAQTAGFDVLTIPTQDQVLTAGDAFKIVWDPQTVKGTVTLTLIQGPASNLLEKGPVIGSGIPNSDGAFTWDPVPAGEYKAYGINITLDSDPRIYQLSNGFHISGSSTGSDGTEPSYTTVSLAPGPSYAALTFTSTSSTPSAVPVPTHNATSTFTTSSRNVTWAAPTSYSASAPVPAYSVVPTGSAPVTPQSPAPSAVSPAETPTQSPISPATVGAASSLGVSGLAIIGGLLAFAL